MPSLRRFLALPDNRPLLLIAAAFLCIHLFANAFEGYGYFRDELYYFACAEHLDAGYADHPPLSIILLAGWRWIAGDSLFALRFPPALFGAAVVFLAGMLARTLGGGKSAQVAASLCAASAPIVMGYTSIWSMNAIELLIWALATLLVAEIAREGRPALWYPLGMLLGLGLLNKISVLWLGFGIAAGLLLTPQRKWLARKEPWLAGAIALALFLPYILWNAAHDWGHLDFIRTASGQKYASQNALTFISDQLLLQNPIAFPLWAGGLIYLFFSRRMRSFRILPIIFLAAALVLLANGHSKAEYLASAFPALYAGGGLLLERLGARRMLRLPARLYPALVALAGVLLIPLAVPILPVEDFIAYQKFIGVGHPSTEGHRMGPLPQFYADMFGWEEKAQAVAQAYYSLSPAERARCAIFGDNYGRCAAIDFFGKKYGLPKSIGRHNSYWIWGPREYTGELVIILGGDLEDKKESFDRVDIAGSVSSIYCMPYENNLRVFICRGLHVPLREFWPRLRVFI